MGNADVLPALVAEPDSAAQIQCVDYLGRSPLYLAVQAGHHDTARMLVRLGANLEWRDVNGLSPLVIAAFNGDVDMCEQLLEDGARPLAKVWSVCGSCMRVPHPTPPPPLFTTLSTALSTAAVTFIINKRAPWPKCRLAFLYSPCRPHVH